MLVFVCVSGMICQQYVLNCLLKVLLPLNCAKPRYVSRFILTTANFTCSSLFNTSWTKWNSVRLAPLALFVPLTVAVSRAPLIYWFVNIDLSDIHWYRYICHEQTWKKLFSLKEQCRKWCSGWFKIVPFQAEFTVSFHWCHFRQWR